MKALMNTESKQVSTSSEAKGLASRGLSVLSSIRSKEDVKALYQQGLVFYEAENYEKALECFLPAAEQGIY